MPKPIPLTSDIMEAPESAPQAPANARGTAKPAKPKPPKVQSIPLQVRLPRDEVRAIKIAAAEREQTVSDFMLACFHAYMHGGKHA
jgi:hypothetical protein